jgi:RNA polymerase sigma factor (sigma-70 family)
VIETQKICHEAVLARRRNEAAPAVAAQILMMTRPSPLSAQDHAELVHYLSRRTWDHHLAEDLAQDAMVRLLSFMEREAVLNPKALAFRIADNLMVNDYRRRKRQAELELMAGPDENEPDAEALLINQERQDEIRAAIDKLPRKRREVLIRRRLHGQSHKEIAEAMGISAASVEKHVVRAIAAIRSELDKSLRRARGAA